MTRAAAALMMCALLPACAAAPAEPRPAAARPPNLLLITLDTTRADHLGCYGDREAATPRLDRLAAEGALAAHAMSPVPLTLPSHASILTSHYPPRHGVRDNADFRLPESEITIAELLKTRGYLTAAVVGSVVLAAAQGLDQGFDVYDEPARKILPAARGTGVLYQPIAERPATEVTGAALGVLGKLSSGPFFLWVHYFDPHGDYAPPAPWRERFASRPYDGEIAYVDSEIGRLLDGMKGRGMLDRTVVAVVADHGEALGEHGESTHGLLLYEGTLRVPMIVRYPGTVRAGVRIENPVSGVDLAPTLLDLMGLPGFADAQGLGFAATLRGGPEVPRGPLYAESLYGERAYGWAPLYALRSGARKFVESPDPELFDLSTDPGESKNRAPSAPGELAAWRERLAALRSSLGAPGAPATREMTEEQRSRLESLGYVSLGAPAAHRKDRPDPKRLVGQNDAFLEARELVAVGRLEQAAAKLRGVLAADPGNPSALGLEGTLLFSLGRREEGLARLRDAVRAARGVFELERNLANALHASGRLDEAAAVYRAALAIQPASPDGRLGLGNVLAALGDFKGALAEYREALRLSPDASSAHAAMGVALEASGDAAGAEREFTRAVKIEPGLVDAWNRLGILADRSGRTAAARKDWERALATEPRNPGLLFNHSKACLKLRDLAPARESVNRLLEAEPTHPSARFLLARILSAAGDREGARDALKRFLAQPNAEPRLLPEARNLLRDLSRT